VKKADQRQNGGENIGTCDLSLEQPGHMIRNFRTHIRHLTDRWGFLVARFGTTLGLIGRREVCEGGGWHSGNRWWRRNAGVQGGQALGNLTLFLDSYVLGLSFFLVYLPVYLSSLFHSFLYSLSLFLPHSILFADPLDRICNY
jgi:hypothetical protein